MVTIFDEASSLVVADAVDAAVGVVITTAYLDEGDAQAWTLPFSVEDNDRFVRTDQGWRFVSRHWDQLFDREEHS